MRQLKITINRTDGEDAALAKYCQNIGREEFLTYRQECDLCEKIQVGKSYWSTPREQSAGKLALNKLICGNLRFVVSVARQYQYQGLSLPDLIGEGNLGLIRAAQKFDVTRGFRFLSYALWWIRQSILQALADQSRMVHLPQNVVSNINKIVEERSRFEQENGRTPSEEELAERLDLPVERISDCLKAASLHVHLVSSYIDGYANPLLDVLPDDSSMADSTLIQESLSQEVDRALNQLFDRDREILKMFFGICCQEMTLEEIGTWFDISPEWVRQIVEKALRRLRGQKSKLLRQYLGCGFSD